MNWNLWMRQSHRWLSMAFVVLVIVNIIANVTPLRQEAFTLWVGLFTLLPLVLMLFTGLYLFLLPYAARRRKERRAS